MKSFFLSIWILYIKRSEKVSNKIPGIWKKDKLYGIEFKAALC